LARQSKHLRRELEWVDDGFDHYEQELAARTAGFAPRTRRWAVWDETVDA